MTRARDRFVVALLAATKLVVAFAVLGAGFVALSDDDFSRVVIAQRFASHGTFDPSGTSWLPLPFWITGGTMAVFGRDLGVARVVAVVLGIAATLLVYVAARHAGASRTGAFLGALAAAVVPTAARLGVSFQPEAFTAALIVFGALTTLTAGSSRLAGGVALGAACFCRYEAWPAAAVFAVICGFDAAKPGADRGAFAAAAALAVAPPVAWIVHGRATHHDALFFLHRVAGYRRALGEGETVFASLVAYPVALVRAEPELTLTSTALVVGALLVDRDSLRRLVRPLLVLGGLFGFLVSGRLLGGAPTHHDERTLLPIWTGLALLAAEIGVRARRDARLRGPMALGVAAVILGAAVAVRVVSPSESFAPRAAERAIGDRARASVGAAERLLIDAPDFGYFAVIAAFGAPERAEPFDRHDPREARPGDAFASPSALGARLAEAHAGWFVATPEHLPMAARVGEALTANAAFTLFRVTKPNAAAARALR